MKICTKCGAEKPETEFFVKDKRNGRLHAQCKACYKEHRKAFYAEHYNRYRQLYLERAYKRRAMLKDEFRNSMLAYIKGKSCVICGESDIRTFEFDHLDPSRKSFSVSQAVRLGHRWPAVLVELEKCRILCANCHKKHTATQANWYKNI